MRGILTPERRESRFEVAEARDIHLKNSDGNARIFELTDNLSGRLRGRAPTQQEQMTGTPIGKPLSDVQAYGTRPADNQVSGIGTNERQTWRG
jgi:hypothetical protein